MHHNKLYSFIVLCSMSLSANALQPCFNNNCVSEPYRPSIFSVISDNASLESIEKGLELSQTNMQAELTRINQRLQLIQQFEAAQKALQLTWVNPKINPKISGVLDIFYDGKKTQICRAKFLTGTHPGLVTSSGCLITYGGYAALIPNYDVLTGKTNTQWRSIDSATLRNYESILDSSSEVTLWKQNVIPIQGGFENGKPTYICKANYNNTVKVGKVIDDICDVADGANEISVREFEVLFGEKS